MIKAQLFSETLNMIGEKLSEDSSYSIEMLRGIVSDVRCLKKYIVKTYKTETNLHINLCLELVASFINDASTHSTKARRFYSSQLISKLLFTNHILEMDILSINRLQDIVSSSAKNCERFFHKEVVPFQ